MSRRKKFIRASEVGEFVFCARAWYLRTEGHEPVLGEAARDAGRRWHLQHGQTVARARRLRYISKACASLAFAIAVLLLLFWWRG